MALKWHYKQHRHKAYYLTRLANDGARGIITVTSMHGYTYIGAKAGVYVPPQQGYQEIILHGCLLYACMSWKCASVHLL